MLGRFTRRVVNFLKQEDGPTAVEYAVMLALIVVVIAAAVSNIGSQLRARYPSARETQRLDKGQYDD